MMSPEELHTPSVGRRLFRPLAVFTALVLAFCAGFILYPFIAPAIDGLLYDPANQPGLSRQQYVDLSGEIYDTLTRQFYQTLDPDALLKGQAGGLGDPYTELMDPAEAAAFEEQLAGEYVGIGVVISSSKKVDAIEIVRVFPGTPAEEAGLKAGDIIDAIDGKSARGLALEDVSLKVKGKAGTSVSLTVERSGELVTHLIVRRRVELPVVESRFVDGTIGYISVSSFSSGVAEKFARALQDIRLQTVDGLVIDVRDNGGGYLNECLEMLSNFVANGTALWTREAGGQVNPVNVSGTTVPFPTVVLVNGNSASASEIFAAAMQENRTATIVGTTTFGKGLIQRSWNLTGGYVLKVTVQEYLTPNKNVIQNNGLKPDFTVADPTVSTLGRLPEDTQLARAVELIREGSQP
jgi:carboxyl-terminal processing protease